MKTIGIVGGVGPFAGFDLLGKILNNIEAETDQAYPPIYSISQPHTIPDRVAFLLDNEGINPGYSIAEQLLKLEQMGVEVAGIPCNTAHAPPIFNVIRNELAKVNSQLKPLHMLQEVGQYLHQHLHLERVGLLATIATYQLNIYQPVLNHLNITLIYPKKQTQREKVQAAISSPTFGIKSQGASHSQARLYLQEAIDELIAQDVQGIILGCTEIPLVISEPTLNHIPMIDPTLILARALIWESSPSQLKPLLI